MKTCTKCGIEKSLDDFWNDNRKNVKPGKKLSVCKSCRNESNRRWKQTNSGKLSSRNTWLKHKYGITSDDFDALVAGQNYQCPICLKKISSDNSVVDHCHATNRVRGILCNGCNIALGCFGDTAEGLRNVLRYLEGSD